MEDGERKELAWKIKKRFHVLMAEELFQVIVNITPVPDRGPSSVTQGDEESCVDFIRSYLNCKIYNNMVFLRDLPFIQGREFKVHGGQVGDNTVYQTSATMDYASRVTRDSR